MRFESVNPATGEMIEHFEGYDSNDTAQAVERSLMAFRRWRRKTYADRSLLMKRVSEVLRGRLEEFARVMTMEMGKPITQSRAEVEKCAWVCDYYATEAERILSKEFIESDASLSYVRFDALGPVLAVMPWNFPFWQVFRFAAPALMAGNTCLLKHASNVPRCALMIEDVFAEAGFPKGCFTTLLITSGQVAAVIEHPAVVAVTLTGSEAAGSKVAEIAGRNLKKTLLELGGSDPFIVLEDADLEVAARTAALARMLNTGQSCIAAKRFIVVDAVAETFEQLFAAEIGRMKVGDPLLDDTEIGAMASEALLLEIDAQVRKSVDMGARAVIGGSRMQRKGAFFEPTLLTGIQKGMPAADEEIFGPVASLFRVPDEEAAVTLANDTVFGLGSSLWTRDVAKAQRLASLIDAGSVFINGLVKSDPRLPFGGIKRSGFGRELSTYGIREFVNIKTVWIR